MENEQLEKARILIMASECTISNLVGDNSQDEADKIGITLDALHESERILREITGNHGKSREITENGQAMKDAFINALLQN